MAASVLSAILIHALGYARDPNPVETMTDDLPTLYVKSGCDRCRKAVEFLDEHGVGHHEKNVTSDPRALKELKTTTGQTNTPTLHLHGAVLKDFNIEDLREFLLQQEVQLEDS